MNHWRPVRPVCGRCTSPSTLKRPTEPAACAISPARRASETRRGPGSSAGSKSVTGRPCSRAGRPGCRAQVAWPSSDGEVPGQDRVARRRGWRRPDPGPGQGKGGGPTPRWSERGARPGRLDGGWGTARHPGRRPPHRPAPRVAPGRRSRRRPRAVGRLRARRDCTSGRTRGWASAPPARYAGHVIRKHARRGTQSLLAERVDRHDRPRGGAHVRPGPDAGPAGVGPRASGGALAAIGPRPRIGPRRARTS